MNSRRTVSRTRTHRHGRDLRARLILGLLMLSSPRPGAAQDGPPPGWKWITDSPARMVDTQEVPASAVRFTSMAPGWHMTTGPGMLLFDPAYEATGRFAVEAEMILFPNPGANGFGVFVGGNSLEGTSPSYISFLVRADGSAGVFRTTGDRIEAIADWSRNDAILPHTGDGTVKNVLRVEAQPSQVVFAVNGKQVASLPRSSIPVDGRFGFRIGEGINLHATNLDFLRRLAPAR
jgi:hypothetical protein